MAKRGHLPRFDSLSRRDVEISSTMSSPLTSLSSLDEEAVPPLAIEPALFTWDDVKIAHVSFPFSPTLPSERFSIGGVDVVRFATAECIEHSDRGGHAYARSDKWVPARVP